MKSPFRNQPSSDNPIHLDYDEVLDFQIVQQQQGLLMQQFLARVLHRHGAATPQNFSANWSIQGGFLVRQDMAQPTPAPTPTPQVKKEG